jgi:nicotinate-nucleotide pyrophosphorylase (carboxylating)
MVVTVDEIRRWLDEDVGSGDATTCAVVPDGTRCRASLLLKEPGIVAGLQPAEGVFRLLDPDLVWTPLAHDGDAVGPGPVATLEGNARAVLTGERLALNLLGRLSGIATLASRYADAVAGTGAVILDTRKTTPGMRLLEKEAVRLGGADNHRLALDDGILVKDNHLAVAPGIAAAVAAARGTGLPVEVECDTIDDVREAVESGADRVLLDNMAPDVIADAVTLAAGRVVTEASGGITLENVRAVAATGVDFISVGALTHSARALDVSLEVLP